MAQQPPSRLAALPGYDTAPDIYETPDLPESQDTNTVSTRSPSPSQDSETTRESDEDGDEDDDDVGGVVSRRRIHTARARRRFDGEGKGVQTRGVDLSDRVDGGRRGYGLRRRGGEEDEGLDARIARLRREVEECQAEAAKAVKDNAAGGEEAGKEGVKQEHLDGLSRLLAVLDASAVDRSKGGRREAVGVSNSASQLLPDAEGGGEGDGDLTEEQTLQKVADFDSRLSALETALGLAALDAGTSTDAASTIPVLPAITLLDQQLAALSSAGSLANLEAASARLNKLRNEVDSTLSSQPVVNGEADDVEPASLSPADLQNLNKLYTLLPTLQSLTPTVPALLTRLRSLRTLHATAASAASALDDVEKRQAEMDDELKSWREGLGRVEGAVTSAQEANGRNGKVVHGWVQELEARMKALER